MKNKFLYILIVVLIVIIVLMRLFQPTPPDMSEYIKIGGEEYILLSKNIDTVWMTKDSLIPVYTPGPTTTVHVEVEIPADVDTLNILKDYFAKNVYNDTIVLDTVGYVSLRDTISQNLIWSREASYSYRIPTVYDVTVVKEKPKNQLYLGGGVNFDKTDILNSAYGSALFKTKKDKIYGVNVGVSTTGNVVKPYLGGSLYWKLKLKD